MTALEPVLRASNGTWVAARPATPIATPSTRATASAYRPTIPHTHCAVSGSPKKKNRATTKASPTKACGRSATSRTRVRFSVAEDWQSYQASEPQVRRRRARRDGRRRAANRARAGLSLRAAAAHGRRKRAPMRASRFSGTSPGQIRKLRHLPVAARTPRRIAGRGLDRLPHPIALQQFPGRRSIALWKRASTWERFAVNRKGHLTRVRPYPDQRRMSENGHSEETKNPNELVMQMLQRSEYPGEHSRRRRRSRRLHQGNPRAIPRDRKIPREDTRPISGRFTFVQIGAPSRTHIERYQELTDEVDQAAERINARFQAPATGGRSCC